MPVHNDTEHSLDLDILIAIHGLLAGEDPEWATEGIALDLDLSVLETRQLLRDHGVDIDGLDKRWASGLKIQYGIVAPLT